MSDAAKETKEFDSVDSVEPLGSPIWSPSSLTKTLKSPIWAPSYPTEMNKNSIEDELFVDYSFPLGDIQLQPVMEWRRPKEISCSPQFIIDGATRMDVCQGDLSDCWFLSAVMSLSLHRPLLKQVVPMEQSFQEGYNGSFYFRFWQYGEWQEVKIDDLLPTKKGQLIYLRSSQDNEFWSPLLEKAYAKLKGGYRALDMGFPHEAMVDMTGGVTEVFNVASLPRALGAFLKPLLGKGALINCANSQGPMEKKNELGILFRHAYAMTRLEKVQTTYGGVVELVRIRNPWGKAEWEGRWSDTDGPDWRQVSDEEQRRLERVQEEDGEFWMSLSDFRQNFDAMEVCHLSDDTLSESGSTKRPWHCTMHHGSWVPNLSAGGAQKGGWYWMNPQFHLTLLEEDDDPAGPDLTCSFLVALMQKHQRRRGVDLAIGLDIYKDLSLRRPLIRTDMYTQRREVVIRGSLAPGHYIIIPSTSETNQEGEFILRVLTEKGNMAIPAEKPSTDENALAELSSLTMSVLPSISAMHELFKKHCNRKGQCRPMELHNLLTEAIGGGVMAGSEKQLCLEHCKSFVVLMDSQGLAQLDWLEFQALWEKFRKWTGIFVKFDKNKSRVLEYSEISPALRAAGIQVDEFILQLIGLRYTEPDMTVSYPGFLYLLVKLDSMIRKFQANDMMGMGTISMNYRKWLHMTMYN